MISLWLGNNYLNGRSYPYLSLLQYGIFAYWEAGGTNLERYAVVCCHARVVLVGTAVVSMSLPVPSIFAFLNALCILKSSLCQSLSVMWCRQFKYGFILINV